MTTSLDGYRKVRLTTDFSLNTSPSLLDSYARKAIFETDFPGVSKRNFIEFASNYCPNKTGKKRELYLLLLIIIIIMIMIIIILIIIATLLQCFH